MVGKEDDPFLLGHGNFSILRCLTSGGLTYLYNGIMLWNWFILGTISETNELPLKIGGWETFSFPFGVFSPFSGKKIVSFREGFCR